MPAGQFTADGLYVVIFVDRTHALESPLTHSKFAAGKGNEDDHQK